MATFEVWKTVSYEAYALIEAENWEEVKQLLRDEAQEWDAINGEETTYTINGEDIKDDQLLEEGAE